MPVPVTRRTFFRAGACGAAASVLGWTGHAQQPGAPPAPPAPTRSRSGAEFINQETQTQIERGLELLARQQYNDGSFPGGALSDRGGSGGWSVGVASLAGLALMAAGNQPGRGRYGKHVARAVVHMASLPLDANILFLTVMATKMPLVGRG